MQTFKMSADNTTAAVSAAVAQMHGFLTKCQQLNQDLPPIDELAKQMFALASPCHPLPPLPRLPLRLARAHRPTHLHHTRKDLRRTLDLFEMLTLRFGRT
jgi:hypothetical protein